MSRAKVVKCEHGFIHSAHIYKDDKPGEERRAVIWVSEGMRRTDSLHDMDVEDARPLLFNCPENCAK